MAVVELVGGFENGQELVDVERAAFASAFSRLTRPSPAGHVSIDPAGIFCLVKDHREGDQRLVDRLVGEGPESLSTVTIAQWPAGLSCFADLRVFGMNALPVVLDLVSGDLAGEQFTEERQEIALQLGLIELRWFVLGSQG